MIEANPSWLLEREIAELKERLAALERSVFVRAVQESVPVIIDTFAGTVHVADTTDKVDGGLGI